MISRAFFISVLTLFLFTPAPKAANGVPTLEAFRKAFAQAFEENDIQLMESLVNWDGMGPKSREALINQLKGEMGGKINLLEIRSLDPEQIRQVAQKNSINVADPQMMFYSFEKNRENSYGGKIFGQAEGQYCIVGFRDPKPQWPYWVGGAFLILLIFVIIKK